jgi:hypothetical protein
MEAVTFLLGIASSLIVGVVIGWYGHVLAGRRAKQDRKVGDETERIDRCSQVFGARIEYVIAYHRKGPGTRRSGRNTARCSAAIVGPILRLS